MQDNEILSLKKVTTQTAARYLNMDDVTLRIGLQRGAFPFGTAFKGNNDRYIYDIRPEALVHYKHHGKGCMADAKNFASEISFFIVESLKEIGGYKS
ncbi:MAG: hypothetical protein Q4B62_05350 [Clostridiaceae bacterium]|nr:hypothetical protein [Clostridiaceae bacterium]